MIGKKNMFRNKRISTGEIDPDEVLLDSHNLPQFDTHQFEGVLERPIGKKTIFLLSLGFMCVGIIFAGRIGMLQIAEGSVHSEQSENNRLKHTPVFADRGVIYDRNNTKLAWNIPNEETDQFPDRAYTDKRGFGHVLGYVKSPQTYAQGNFYQYEFSGVEGVEYAYNNMLNGTNGIKIVETNAVADIVSESIMERPADGTAAQLTIDADIQAKLYELMETLAHDKGFTGGSAVILDVNNGEVLSLTNYPEYNPAVLSEGEDRSAIAGYSQNGGTPFLNRAVNGLYTPGSVVKPIMGIAALNEGVIDPDTEILSTGSISVPNPYNPELKSVFTDWKAHGWVDIRNALALSSNVYFYEVGGGFEDQEGIGIHGIESYARLFGLGKKTGIDLPEEHTGTIPNPEWKEETFDGEPWRLGDTYHTAIGQYGFQVTPLQMVRAIAAIANEGTLVTPHIVKTTDPKNVKVGITSEHYMPIKEGMRMAVTQGTAQGLSTPYVKVAAKTGTAELGVSKSRVNSWIVGFFPYEKPRYAFAVVMEEGPRENLVGGLYVMRQLIEWIASEKPEYFESGERQ